MQKQMEFTQKFLNAMKDEGAAEKFKDILYRFLGHFSINVRDASGSTILHHCIRYNNIEVIKRILAIGCNINLKDKNGNTPLMIATMENREAAMMLLLAAGANVLKVNKQKKSVLHMLNKKSPIKCETLLPLLQAFQKQCSSGKEVAQRLVNAKSPLYQAVILKDVEVAEHMLELDRKLIASTLTANKITALHVAVFLNNLKMVKLFVKYGADVNALDIFKANPLYNLYKKYREHSRDKIEIMKILLSQGASMTTCTGSGDLQVCDTLVKGNAEVIRVLIESGLDFNAKSTHNYPIHYLAGNANAGVAEELKRHVDKFDVNARDKFGQTPLFVATFEGNVGIVKFLLENGAKTEISNRHGMTALYVACHRSEEGFEEKFREIGEMLLQHNANPQIVLRNKDGTRVSTIFDSVLKRGNFNRIKPVVAHMAILEKRGTLITGITRRRIDSHRLLKNYLERCQRVLKEKIAGRVVLFNLLTADEKRMAKYLNNKSIFRKIREKKFRRKMSNYKYCLNVLDKRYMEGDRHKKLRSKAATIFREIFRNRIDETHIVVDSITDYLDDQGLQQLCKLSRAARRN